MVNVERYPIEVKPLYTPPLQEAVDYLNKNLRLNFNEVNVEMIDCPDLTKEPFFLAGSGLGGKTKIIDLGGTPYLLPIVNRDKLYDFKHIVNLVNSDPLYIIGAGAGPYPYARTNCEGIYNLKVANESVVQKSRISRVDENDNAIQEILPSNETRVALLANLFLTEGKPGKVLKVHVKKRIGNDNFITCLRKVFEREYKDKNVGVGGVFLIKQGKAKHHVMRDFSKTPIINEEQLNKWLKFYNMSAPIISVGTFVNSDMDLDLRIQHFHSFSLHGEAGHYHYDITPNTVEYLGYFNFGEEIYRIDRPEHTHSWGRD